MIVVDASVLANALADDGDDGRACREVLLAGGDLAAPDLVDVETVSVLRKQWLVRRLPAARFRSALDDLESLPLTRYPTLSSMRRAYELRANVTPYDAAYVALAEALGCPLVTGDQRLAGASGPACEIRVVQAGQPA